MKILTRTQAANAYGRQIFMLSKLRGFQFNTVGGVITVLIESSPDQEVFTAVVIFGTKVSDGIVAIMDRDILYEKQVLNQIKKLSQKEPLELKDFLAMGFERPNLGMDITGPQGWQQGTR